MMNEDILWTNLLEILTIDQIFHTDFLDYCPMCGELFNITVGCVCTTDLELPPHEIACAAMYEE